MDIQKISINVFKFNASTGMMEPAIEELLLPVLVPTPPTPQKKQITTNNRSVFKTNRQIRDNCQNVFKPRKLIASNKSNRNLVNLIPQQEF